jgi:multidrug efflux pump subunit AcrA (membrane-fusion protein)
MAPILRLLRGGSAIRRLAAIAAWVSLAVAPGQAEDRRQTQAATEIIVQRVKQECFSSLVHASGYLVPRNAAVVMFNAPDYRITEVKAKAGDTIKKGDVVALATPLTPPANAPAGAADVSIKSLAAGLVVKSSIFPGMITSQKSAPLFLIAVDGEIEAAVDVLADHLSKLKQGQTVHLTTSDGIALEGRLRQLPGAIKPASQMGEARISIDGGEGLTPQLFVRATLESSRSCGLAAPRAALRRTAGGAQVQVIEGDVVVTHTVSAGMVNDTDVEITKGLEEGDLVVASTDTSLRDGDRVRPIFANLQDAR